MADKNSAKVAEQLLHLMFLVHKKMMRPVIQQSDLDLSPLQVHVLDTLGEEKAATMTVLANEVKMPKTQMTRIVDKLVSRGLVGREYDPSDRRIVKISLTDAGLVQLSHIKDEAIQKVGDKLAVLDGQMLSDLSAAATVMGEIVKRLP